MIMLQDEKWFEDYKKSLTKMTPTKFETILNLSVRINIKSPKESEILQKQLFKHNYKWGWYTFEQVVKLTNFPALLLYPKHKYFLYCISSDWKNSYYENVIDFEDIIF